MITAEQLQYLRTCTDEEYEAFVLKLNFEDTVHLALIMYALKGKE